MIKIYISQASPWLRLLSKFIIQMKIAIFIIFITCLNVSAKVFSQEKLSLDLKNVKLEKALQIIEKQSGYRFVYSPTEGPFNKLVSIKTSQAPLEEVMQSLLSGTALNFNVRENNLITILASDKFNQDLIIRGVVKDETNTGLPGVTVAVKGVKGLAVSTDGEGRFSLKVPENAILVFSAIGYISVEVPASESLINVQLKPANNNLDEVVIQAYGTTTKRKTTSAISTLDMNAVASIPVASINDAIAGRAQGVIVTTNSGSPGTKSTISIRGGGTPLFVIDNVIRSANDFANINPNDIETYSILKDAAATALYGVSAANGVILVTTKKGKEGTVNINYAFNQVFSQPTLFPNKLSSYDQRSAINTLYAAEGKSPYTSPADLEKYRTGSDPLNFPNTDWRALTMKNFAPEMRHDLSISSGTKLLTYYGGLSYYDQGTILKTDKNYNRRATYRLNTSSDLEKANLKVVTAFDGYVESNSQPSVSFSNLYSHIQNKQPTFQAYNEFGLPSINTPDNPVVELDPKSGYNRRSSRVFNGNLSLEYSAHFLEGLKFKLNGNYNTINSEGKIWNYFAPSYANGSKTAIPGPAPTLTGSSSSGNTLTLQGYITYNKTFGDHSIDFTGVYEQQQFKTSGLNVSRVGYQLISDQFIAGPTENQTINIFDGSNNLITGEAESARAAYIGRISYSFKNRYSLEASLRRDGSDLFVPGKQWGTFYALSGSYMLSDETFMKGLKEKHILDYLKLRGSYGKTGNSDNIGRFLYVAGYRVASIGYVMDGKPVQGTSEPSALPSINYSWQTIKSRNIGIDMASLNNRLNTSVDYFYTRTTGFVTSDPQFAETLGIGLPPINFTAGAIRKEGVEFNVNWNSKVSELTYKVGLNFTYFNTLNERSTLDDDATLRNPFTRVSGQETRFLVDDSGRPILGLINNGFYTTNRELLNGARRVSSTDVVAGDLRYQDLNGDGKIDDNDRVRIGNNTFPRINFGLTVDLGYKGFSFSAVMQGSGNRDRYIGDVVQGANPVSLLTYQFQQDYWRTDNQDALFPRAVSTSSVNGGNNFARSDFWLIQSKYLRLKYVQLGYDFKHSLLKKSKFQQLRLFVSGTNLLTSSKSQDYFIDPESDPNNYGYPVQRTFALGVSAGF